jgi:unsaturated chondroitin disaccharide hydrolase
MRFISSFLLAAFLLSAHSLELYPQDKINFDKTIDYCISQLEKSIIEISNSGYPIRTEGIGKWELTEPESWTSGFFAGCLWYANELKPDEELKSSAIKYTESLAPQQYNKGTHDIGFMMFNSFGNGLKFAGKEEYKSIILESARSLASRFNNKVGCIQSWNGDFQVIIDNMMNLELLFWAAKNGGDESLYNIAVAHANTTMKNHLRDDASAFHVVVYDTATGDIIKKKTAQGFADNSAWARGQAWGIYGFTMCYRETKDTAYLNTAVRMADYFLKHLPADYVPYWDFNLPADNPKQFRDASAASIAVSAFLELRNYTDDPSIYDEVIGKILSSLSNNYLSVNTASSGLILHSAYNCNTQNPHDWDSSTIWGDYYFLEALYRYKNM